MALNMQVWVELRSWELLVKSLKLPGNRQCNWQLSVWQIRVTCLLRTVMSFGSIRILNKVLNDYKNWCSNSSVREPAPYCRIILKSRDYRRIPWHQNFCSKNSWDHIPLLLQIPSWSFFLLHTTWTHTDGIGTLEDLISWYLLDAWRGFLYISTNTEHATKYRNARLHSRQRWRSWRLPPRTSSHPWTTSCLQLVP